MLVSLHLTCTFAIEYTVLNFILNYSFQDDLDYGPTQGRATIEEYPLAGEQGFQNKANILNPTHTTHY